MAPVWKTGAAGRPLVRWLERVCGRPRRPQSRRRVAVRAEVPWATKEPGGLEPSWVIEAFAEGTELDRFQGGWSRKRRLTSRRSGSCASATEWAYTQPKADRFSFIGLTATVENRENCRIFA